MSNFILQPSRDHIGILLQRAPGFANSHAYLSLDDDDRQVPGLVYSAFARHFEASVSDSERLTECRNAIEEIAMSGDTGAHNLLVTEVFEGFRFAQNSKQLLPPHSRALYDQWIGN